MAATVIVNEYHGTQETTLTRTDKTAGTVRFKNADNFAVDLLNPMVVPGAGQDYSFEKVLRLQITDEGGFTQIDNVRAYSDGTNNFGTGIDVFYAVGGTYIEPTEPNNTPTTPQSPYAGSPQENMTDWFTTNSGSPADMDSNNPGPFTGGSPTEEIADFIALVMKVASTASQGVLTGEVATFAWDEI